MLDAQQVASNVLKRRFIATVADISRFNRACREAGINPWVIEGQFSRSYLDLAADNNLQLATTPTLEKTMARLEKQIAQSQESVCRRAMQGRTRGAGAGGFNRDLERARHSGILAQLELKRLQNELDRRQQLERSRSHK